MTSHFPALAQIVYAWPLTFLAWHRQYIHDLSLSRHGTCSIYMTSHFPGMVSCRESERSCIYYLCHAWKVRGHVYTTCVMPGKWEVMYILSVPCQESERSCIYYLSQVRKVRGHVYTICVMPGKWEVMYILHVPCLESERSCIYYLCHAWKVRGHVYTICVMPGKWEVMHILPGMTQIVYTWPLTFQAWHR
jgi:hypothetical protein